MRTESHFEEGQVHMPADAALFNGCGDGFVRLNVRPAAETGIRYRYSTTVRMTPKQALDLARDLIQAAQRERESRG